MKFFFVALRFFVTRGKVYSNTSVIFQDELYYLEFFRKIVILQTQCGDQSYCWLLILNNFSVIFSGNFLKKILNSATNDMKIDPHTLYIQNKVHPLQRIGKKFSLYWKSILSRDFFRECTLAVSKWKIFRYTERFFISREHSMHNTGEIILFLRILTFFFRQFSLTRVVEWNDIIPTRQRNGSGMNGWHFNQWWTIQQEKPKICRNSW